jgi:hypothetical protein
MQKGFNASVQKVDEIFHKQQSELNVTQRSLKNIIE